ncbi:MAG: ABC transporter permease [Tepidiformaceae bacterium]
MATDAHVLAQAGLRREKTARERYLSPITNFVRTKPLGTFGAVIVIVLILAAAFPGVFSFGTSPDAQVLSDRLQGPSSAHWFGTDQLGRDLYTRIVYGARTSITIGFGVVFVSSVIATVLGVMSGYYGGWFDTVTQRLVDIGIALPGLIFIILFVTSIKEVPFTHTPISVILAIIISVGLLIAVGSSRVIRGAAIGAKQNQYVEAARVLGASDTRIIFRHVLPNVFAVILVGASIQIGGAILIESSLAFLGYGVQPPTASWGRSITEAQVYLVNYPHLAIFPGLAIFFTVYSFNMLGDALRDVLDPRLRGSR